MKDAAKIAGREIAKKRLEANYKRDEMVAISSADFAQKEEDKPVDSSPSKQQLTDELNKPSTSSSSKTFTPKVNSFQKMLEEQELKGVTKKQPKKGMQLGKKKPKKSELLKDLEKQNIIAEEQEKTKDPAEQVEEEKQPE